MSESQDPIHRKWLNMDDPGYPFLRQKQYWDKYNPRLIRVAEEFSPPDREGKKFRLHWYQRQMFYAYSQYDRVCTVASRQVGKTENNNKFAFAFAMAVEHSEQIITSSGKRHASYILRRIKDNIHNSPYKIPLKIDSASEVEFFNGSRIFCLPSVAKTLPGYSPNIWYIDEVDAVVRWEEFFEAGSAMVSRTKRSKILATGTYYGKRQLWALMNGAKGSQTSNNKFDWTCLKYPVTVNPPPDILQQVHDYKPMLFDQQFMCIPADIIGTLFPYEFLESCYELNNNNEPIYSVFHYQRDAECIYFGGWDCAKKRDASAFTILEFRATELQLRVVGVFDFKGMAYPDQYKEIKKLDDKWKFYTIGMDRTGAQATCDGLKEVVGKKVWGIDLTPKNKAEMSNDFSLAVANREVSFGEMLLDHNGYPRVFNELHNLDPKKLDHQPGGTSDYAWSIMIAWHIYERIARQLLNSANNKYIKVGGKRRMELPAVINI